MINLLLSSFTVSKQMYTTRPPITITFLIIIIAIMTIMTIITIITIMTTMIIGIMVCSIILPIMVCIITIIMAIIELDSFIITLRKYRIKSTTLQSKSALTNKTQLPRENVVFNYPCYIGIICFMYNIFIAKVFNLNRTYEQY